MVEQWENEYDGDFYSHAPSGAQLYPEPVITTEKHFYSHAPSGAQPSIDTVEVIGNEFLLTRPEWGATNQQSGSPDESINFYSHAPSGAQLIPW